MQEDPATDDVPRIPGLARLTLVAGVAGAAIGVVGGAFQWSLLRLGERMLDLVTWARDNPGPAWLLPIAVTTMATIVARSIVRLVPLAAGSGIQHVEAVALDETGPAPFRVLPAKFVGGLLSLGSGLVLGREGPTVQMGAVLGGAGARLGRLDTEDRRVLQIAAAGAGLGVAFSAPLGGALFAVEEVAKSFRVRLMLAVLVSCSTAVAVSQLFVGDALDLPVGPMAAPSIGLVFILGAFGLATGLLGAAYNWIVIRCLTLADRSPVRNPLAVAGAIGAVIGTAFVVNPDFATGGDALTRDVLNGDLVLIAPLLGYLGVRLMVGPVSYASGVPGGLFAPLLAVGALWGALIHGLVTHVGVDHNAATTFAVVGMAAFFAGVVRAPLTGVALITEMTGASHLTVAMLAACCGAVLVATQFRSAPVYDTLRLRMLGELGSGGATNGRPGR